MACEEQFPEFDTVEEFFEAFELAKDKAYIKQSEREDAAFIWAEVLLGTEDDESTVRGRVKLLTDAMEIRPRENFTTVLPLEKLTDQYHIPLIGADRQIALAVNEFVLDTLYEESGVDRDLSEVGDFLVEGDIERRITHFTDHGYTFNERRVFRRGDNPDHALPIAHNVTVDSWRNESAKSIINLIPGAPIIKD